MLRKSLVRKSTKRCKSARFSGKRSLNIYAKAVKAIHKAKPALAIAHVRASAKKLYKKVRKSSFVCHRG